MLGLHPGTVGVGTLIRGKRVCLATKPIISCGQSGFSLARLHCPGGRFRHTHNQLSKLKCRRRFAADTPDQREIGIGQRPQAILSIDDFHPRFQFVAGQNRDA